MMGTSVWLRGMRKVAAGVAVATLVLATGTAAQADTQFAKDFGYGMGATGANLIYMPTKIVYATLGGITGSFAYALTGGNMAAAKKVWTPSMGGDYVVTAPMLRGEERVMFSGVTEPRTTAVASTSGQQFAPARAEAAPAPVVEEGSNESYSGY